jgi:hypothetical protein
MFVSLCAASIAVILHAIQRSRCTDIKCGCVHCERAAPPIDQQPDPPEPRPTSHGVPLRPTFVGMTSP